ATYRRSARPPWAWSGEPATIKNAAAMSAAPNRYRTRCPPWVFGLSGRRTGAGARGPPAHRISFAPDGADGISRIHGRISQGRPHFRGRVRPDVCIPGSMGPGFDRRGAYNGRDQASARDWRLKGRCAGARVAASARAVRRGGVAGEVTGRGTRYWAWSPGWWARSR